MMIPSRLASVRRFNWVSILISSVLVTFLAACGGGGGGGGREDDPPPEDAVTITGVVDDGNSPIVGANCRFVDMDGAELDSDRSDSTGTYHLYIPPGVAGYILATPENASDLTLSTVSSTFYLGLGSVKSSEDVNPTTTLAADIIRNENPEDPERRKAELLGNIESGRDADLALVATLATRLYRSMLSRGMNTRFSGGLDGSDDSGGPSDSDVDGGGQGEAGDGADFSPLAEANCEFVYGNELATAEVCYSAALADLFACLLYTSDAADENQRV